MTAKKIIFVVDDDPKMLEVISLIIRDDCTFYTFPDANEQFFALLSQIIPDVVILDYVTPLGNVIQAVEHIKKIYNGRTKVILMSALKQSKIPIIPGVDVFLGKPFNVIDLKQLLDVNKMV